eukprot:3223317-Amphidinium_carterae.1
MKSNLVLFHGNIPNAAADVGVKQSEKLATSGDLAVLKLAWMSVLAEPGFILHKRDSNKYLYVLAANQHGAVVWPVKLSNELRGVRYISWDTSEVLRVFKHNK